MNIIFLSIAKISTLETQGIYTDLLREFVQLGNRVFCVTSSERRYGEKTFLKKENNAELLVVKTLNIQKTNIFEKGLATLFVGKQYKKAIKSFFKNIKFDLIVYPTPPITLCGVVRYLKRRNDSFAYLLLKDIFPQNAVDIGLLSKSGLKGFLYRYFRKKEKSLYNVSDEIGCMSPANVEYVVKHNSELDKNKVSLLPNCIKVLDSVRTEKEKIRIRTERGLPLDKTVFVYGGNLGKPQDIPFIIKCLEREKNNSKAYFLIVGDGTEYSKLEQYYKSSANPNFKLLSRIGGDEFNELLNGCDVGLVFLDHRFTIPNIPSRVLSYMQAKIPVLSCTDSATDLGKIICQGNFGWSCISQNVDDFHACISKVLSANDLVNKGNNGFLYLKNHDVSRYAALIIERSKK